MDYKYYFNWKKEAGKTVLFFTVIFILSCCMKNPSDKKVLFKGTVKPVPDSTILPHVPIWTKHAKMFIYAPAFDFPLVKNAVKYDYKIFTSDGSELSFEAAKPNLPLSPVWEKVPEGTVILNVVALNESNDSIGLAGSKRFYRSIPFQGVKNRPVKPYKDAAYNALKYIYHLPHIQKWETNIKPDLDYIYYAYPAKIVSAAVDAMLLFSENKQTSKEDSIKAMAIALNMSNHLESVATSKHPLLKHFPATYDVEFSDMRLQDTIKNPRSPHITYVYSIIKANRNKYMMLYGYEYANLLLKIFDRTGDEKYMAMVRSIAESYKKLQLTDGSWYLKIDYQTTEAINPNRMIPGDLLIFYKKLETEYAITGYHDVVNKADKWVRENPLKTYYWEGQFEDVPAYDEHYRNLSKYPPTNYAIYLLRYAPTKENIVMAKELVRFAEDQFVIWGEAPADTLMFGKEKYHTPGVMEQYYYFVPVDASACQMIKTYLEIYNVTKEKEYYHKAEALTNSITEQQEANGEIYTIWRDEGPTRQNWLNCMVFSVNMLLYFDEIK